MSSHPTLFIPFPFRASAAKQTACKKWVSRAVSRQRKCTERTKFPRIFFCLFRDPNASFSTVHVNCALRLVLGWGKKNSAQQTVGLRMRGNLFLGLCKNMAVGLGIQRHNFFFGGSFATSIYIAHLIFV